MLNKLDGLFDFHAQALKMRSQRQEILAANIANADTPGYKARDIDFKEMMQEVKSQSSNSDSQSIMPQQLKLAGNLNKTSDRHISGQTGAQNLFNTFDNELLYRPIRQGSVDGNTVDMDVERNQFADNAIRYEASILKMNGLIKSMMTAIQGQ